LFFIGYSLVWLFKNLEIKKELEGEEVLQESVFDLYLG